MADKPAIPLAIGEIAFKIGARRGGLGSGARSEVTSRSGRRLLRIGVSSMIVALIVAAALMGTVQKWLWMGQLGFDGIFWTLLTTQWAMFGAAFAVTFLFVWINLRQAGKYRAALPNTGHTQLPNGGHTQLPNGGHTHNRAAPAGTPDVVRGVSFFLPRLSSSIAAVSSAVLALLFAINFYNSWDTYIRFRFGGSVGVTDPLFGLDIGFYLFRLPFYTLLQSGLTALSALTLVGVVLMYRACGLLRIRNDRRIAISGAATGHLCVLLCILMAAAGAGFYLDHYELVYSTLGIVHGAGYAADHVTRLSLWFMVAISGAACVLLAFNVMRRQFGALLVGSAIYGVLYLVAVQLLPAAFQKLRVEPNELALETPYLNYYIDFTRKAYQLDAVQEIAYPAQPDQVVQQRDRSSDGYQPAVYDSESTAGYRMINASLTSYVTRDSRIQIWLRAQDRVAQIAPFLRLDSDPYPVLSGGRLYWIQDAYTVSDRYPYSNPHATGYGNSLNYIRNSVKVVVDMYDGSVSFYVMDPKDPLLAVYQRAFPGVFKNLNRMAPDLKAHLRYPEDQFVIQADEYKTFHMTDPQVFYNREDLWVSPHETYAGKSAATGPSYILMKLPGSDQLEYLLMTPFTPQNRDDMISWLAARCDFPDYGKMIFYQRPKQKLVYGPSQIEAMATVPDATLRARADSTAARGGRAGDATG
jgi:uncharacterized membrane protein (UPF0182 family)